METAVIVMIVTLAMPNGDNSVSIKPMLSVENCRVEAKIEASDPFVANVECSELNDGRLELMFKHELDRKIPEPAVDRSTG